MKLLALYHTAWTQMAINCWKRLPGLEVAEIPLPTVDWNLNPELKARIASLIVEYGKVWKPDLIVDVNGAGIIPVPGEKAWTPELAGTPWAEWWFDDPVIYADGHSKEGSLEAWLQALSCPLVENFIWDATLAKEHSVWTGRRWTHLPTAVDPEAFSPKAAESSPVKFPPFDISFLGSHYPPPGRHGDPELDAELEGIASRRIASPSESYFEIFAKEPSSFAKSAAAFDAAKHGAAWGAFAGELPQLRGLCNAKTGEILRTRPLDEIAKAFPSRLFVGEGWPPSFNAVKDKLYMPSCLSACYRASGLCLDLGNGQSFSGTNMRVYEIMASGGAMACNRRPDFDPEGKFEGQAYLFFKDADGLAASLEELKSKPAFRKELGESARACVESAHSWTRRLESMLETMRLAKP